MAKRKRTHGKCVQKGYSKKAGRKVCRKFAKVRK